MAGPIETVRPAGLPLRRSARTLAEFRKQTRFLGTLALAALGLYAVITLVFLALHSALFPSGTVAAVVGAVFSALVIGALVFIIRRLYERLDRFDVFLDRRAAELVAATEGRYKAMIQRSFETLFVIDTKGDISYVSPSVYRTLGYQSEDLTGQNIYDLLQAEDQFLLRNAVERRMEQAGLLLRAQRQTGEWLYMEFNVSSMLDDPHVQGVVLSARDVSDRKREEALRLEKERAAIRLSLEKDTAEKEKSLAVESKRKLEQAFRMLEYANNEIRDSLNYAARIQRLLLTGEELLAAHLPDSFVLWRPKEMVSGDFYWCVNQNGRTYVAVADCTGHGVPGAFMTIIGNSILNDILLTSENLTPNEILRLLHEGVRFMLKQKDTDEGSKDGMDVALAMLEPDGRTMHFAGAHNPALVVRDGEAILLEGDRKSIGGRQVEEGMRTYALQTIELKPGDTVFLYSDGFQDQFGGKDGRKFLSKRFRQLLVRISTEPLEAQSQVLGATLDAWIGDDYEQIDDITVLGFRVR